MKAGIRKALVSLAILFAAVIIINPVKVEAAKKYNVTFVYGTNIVTQQVKAGKNAVVPTNVDVPGFIFAGWTDTAVNIRSDKVILGMYVPTTAKTQNVAQNPNVIKYNNDVSAPGEPWWDWSLKGVPGKTCVVRWYNGHNGELWKTEVVPYGTTLPDPANPCLDHYDFVGWRGSWQNITEDRNIEACYYHTNKVTFIDDFNGGVFWVNWVRDGEGSKAPEVPDHRDKGKKFKEFDRKFNHITGDIEVRAIYEDL